MRTCCRSCDEGAGKEGARGRGMPSRVSKRSPGRRAPSLPTAYSTTANPLKAAFSTTYY